jgi:hypothetical protein
MPEAEDHNIVPAHLAVKAMRDNGYKNAAYAIAELMDNAIQAGASNVELLCGEREVQLDQRKSSRIQKIAVLDNGSGMDEHVLRLALQFGNGTHLDPEDQEGIGKFGMGLPSSSMSQCREVDVWSWQDGIENALHTTLDLDKILNEEMSSVPQPMVEPIPARWRRVGQTFGKSGTLVVWSNLDRVMWKTARAIIRNSERLIGRIYRRFLADGRAQIRMHSFDLDAPERGDGINKYAGANDPLYLMEDTSCPFEEEPMFERWGSTHEIPISHEGEEHEVKVTVSVAKEEARSMPQAGAKEHGRHAAKNVGVSVIRAGRELEMEDSWVIQYDPRERWWGVEVEFPPALDEIFGVSNNKQAARNFHQLDEDTLKQDGETNQQLKERLIEENDPSGPLLEVSKTIDRNLRVLREHIKGQREGTRGAEKRHEESEAEELATEKTRERQDEGHEGESDEEEDLSEEERKEEVKQGLEESGLPEDAAEGLAAHVVESGLKYTFSETALPTSSPIFSVKRKGGVIIINLNTKHPGYDSLIAALDEEEDEEKEDLRDRLRQARKSLRLLLLAWARHEDEQQGEQRERLQDTRNDWGRLAREFMREND